MFLLCFQNAPEVGKYSVLRTAGLCSCGCFVTVHLFLLSEKKGLHGSKTSLIPAFPAEIFSLCMARLLSQQAGTTNRIAVISAGGVTTDGAQRLPQYKRISQERCWGDAAP